MKIINLKELQRQAREYDMIRLFLRFGNTGICTARFGTYKGHVVGKKASAGFDGAVGEALTALLQNELKALYEQDPEIYGLEACSNGEVYLDGGCGTLSKVLKKLKRELMVLETGNCTGLYLITKIKGENK